MNDDKMKNIVILKNLPSNVVEEAIVVLKKNKVKQCKYENKNKEENTNNSVAKDYILKEAEMVISNYISKIEDTAGNSIKQNEIKKKYNRLKTLSICLSIALFFLIIF